MAPRKLAPPTEPARIVDVPDPVLVAGDKVRLKGQHGTYIFVSRRQNVATGVDWYDVTEGNGGAGIRRSVTLDRVRKVSTRKVAHLA
jgi:hypothetical protein